MPLGGPRRGLPAVLPCLLPKGKRLQSEVVMDRGLCLFPSSWMLTRGGRPGKASQGHMRTWFPNPRTSDSGLHELSALSNQDISFQARTFVQENLWGLQNVLLAQAGTCWHFLP